MTIGIILISILLTIIVFVIYDKRLERKANQEMLAQFGVPLNEEEKKLLLNVYPLHSKISAWGKKLHKGGCDIINENGWYKLTLYYKATPVFVIHYQETFNNQPKLLYMLKSQENVDTINTSCWTNFKEYFNEYSQYLRDEKQRKDAADATKLEEYKIGCA
jgi:hypothetical protein